MRQTNFSYAAHYSGLSSLSINEKKVGIDSPEDRLRSIVTVAFPRKIGPDRLFI